MEREGKIRSLPGSKSSIEIASELAARQFAAVARRQLEAAGISPSQIRSWTRTGRLHPRYPGVFAWGREDLSTEGELAATLLLAGPGAGLHSLTALWWQGLLHRRPDPVQVASPHRRRSRPGVRIFSRSPLPRHLHRGLPVVPLAEATLAATAQLSRNALRLVLARAEYARLLDRPALEAVARSGRPGASRLRAALDAHLPALAACANGWERDFVLLCEREGIPIPEPNPRLGRYRPDMLWREARLIVELDGDPAHHSPAQLAADRSRQAWLESRGFTVLRFTHEEVAREPGRTAAMVRSHLGV
jgi:hypothetical protein